MRFSTRAGGIAAAISLCLFAFLHPTPSRAWQYDDRAVLPAIAPAPAPAIDPALAPQTLPQDQPETIVQPAPDAPAADVPEALDAEGECLATAVYFEAKGEPMRGQLAVAQVIVNRTRSGRFPASLCGVVRQRGQFSFVRGGRLPAAPRGSPAWRKAVAIAHMARNDLGERPVGDALFFHARRVSPGWHSVRVAAIGNQIFYR